MESSLVVVVGEEASTFGRRQGEHQQQWAEGEKRKVSFGTCVSVLFGKGVLKKQSHVEAILFVLGTYAALDMRVCVCNCKVM